MAQKIASMYVELTADSGKLTRGLSDAKKQLQETAKASTPVQGGLMGVREGAAKADPLSK